MPDKDMQNIKDDIIRQSMQMAGQNVAEVREESKEMGESFTDKFLGIMDNYIERDETVFQIMAELFDLMAMQTLSVLDSLVDSITISNEKESGQRLQEEGEKGQEKQKEEAAGKEADEESFGDFMQSVIAEARGKLVAMKEFAIETAAFAKGEITADALRQEAGKVEESLKAGGKQEEREAKKAEENQKAEGRQEAEGTQRVEESQKAEKDQMLQTEPTEQEIQANEAVNEFVKRLEGQQKQGKAQEQAWPDNQRNEAREKILNETKNAARINGFAEVLKASGGKAGIGSVAAFATALVNSPEQVMASYLDGKDTFSKVLENGAKQNEGNGQEVSNSDMVPGPADKIEMDAKVAMATKIAMGMEQLSHIFENSDDIERGMLAGGMLQHMNAIVDSSPELKEAMDKIELYQKNQMKYRGEGYMGSIMAQGREALRSFAQNPGEMAGSQAEDIMMGQQMELLYVGSKGKGTLGEEAGKRGAMSPEKEQRERIFLSQTRMGSRLMSKEGRGEVLSQMADLKKRVQLAKETSQQAGKKAQKYAKHMDLIKEFNQMNAADREKFLEEQRRKILEKRKREQERAVKREQSQVHA